MSSPCPQPEYTGVLHQDIYIYQGDRKTFDVVFSNPDGSPADLTGYTVLAQIRMNVADMAPEVVATFTTAITDNIVTLTLYEADSVKLAGRYQWDLQLTDPGGAPTTFMRGAVIAVQEVSRP